MPDKDFGPKPPRPPRLPDRDRSGGRDGSSSPDTGAAGDSPATRAVVGRK